MKKSVLLKVLFLCFFIMFFIKKSNATEITTSIFPTTLIVSMVVENSNKVNMIIKNNASPHHQELTYQQIKEIKNAKILVIASRSLEVSVLKHFDSNKNTLIVLDELPNLKLYKFSNANYNSKDYTTHTNKENKHDHEHEDEHAHELQNNKELNDYHIWLDTDNVKVIIIELAKILGEKDPKNKDIYNQNAKKNIENLTNLDKEINNTLKNYKTNVMFYHDAWQYFTKKYNIKNLGAIITLSGEHAHDINAFITPKKLYDLKQTINKNNIKCIISEPELKSKSLEDFFTKNNIKTVELNTLETYNGKARNYNTLYFDLMLENAKKLSNCY